MTPFTCISDLRDQAKRRVPRAFFEYAISGSYNEETLRANRADLEAIKLRQRILIDVDKRDLSTSIVGQKAALPIALAPIGLCGMQHGDGEILAAKAANEAGVPFTLSTTWDGNGSANIRAYLDLGPNIQTGQQVTGRFGCETEYSSDLYQESVYTQYYTPYDGQPPDGWVVRRAAVPGRRRAWGGRGERTRRPAPPPPQA